jgi:flagellar basal body-associated protein FliL
MDLIILLVIASVVVVVVCALMWGIPVYNVWAAHKSGQADLARAQNEQMIQVAEAEGRVKAAEANKKAAIIEAEAVAKQVEVIGTNLQKHDLYLKWQWIRMMEEREGETIYVPTEANLPILEAARLRNA